MKTSSPFISLYPRFIMEDLLTTALSATPSLSEHLDEDTTEYILSILLDDPSDEDAREAVQGFFLGHDIQLHVCEHFFANLDDALNNNGVGNLSISGGVNSSAIDGNNQVPRKLDNAVSVCNTYISYVSIQLVTRRT